jgi:hypothetical protein
MFQYYYDSAREAWIAVLDGHEIERFNTEAEAKQFCDENNSGQVVESIDA